MLSFYVLLPVCTNLPGRISPFFIFTLACWLCAGFHPDCRGPGKVPFCQVNASVLPRPSINLPQPIAAHLADRRCGELRFCRHLAQSVYKKV